MPRQKWRGISIFGMTNPFEPPAKRALPDDQLAEALAKAQADGGSEAAMQLLEEQSIQRAADASGYLHWVRQMESLGTDESRQALSRARNNALGVNEMLDGDDADTKANDESWKSLVPDWEEREQTLAAQKKQAIAEAIEQAEELSAQQIEVAVAQALAAVHQEAEDRLRMAVDQAKTEAEQVESLRVAQELEIAKLETEAKIAEEQRLLEMAKAEAELLSAKLLEEQRLREEIEQQARLRAEAQAREQAEREAAALEAERLRVELEEQNRLREEIEAQEKLKQEAAIQEELELAEMAALEAQIAAEEDAKRLAESRQQLMAQDLVDSEPEPVKASEFATGSFEIIESAEQAATEDFDQGFEVLLKDGELGFAREPEGQIEDRPLSTIDRRSSPVSQLFVWSSLTVGFASLMFGYLTVSLDLSALDKILALFGGLLISAAITATAAIAGKRSGLSTLVLSRAAFGVKGNLVAAIMQVLAKLTLGIALLFAVTALFDGVFVGAPVLTEAAFEIGSTSANWQVVSIVVVVALASLLAFFGGKTLYWAQVSIAAVATIASLVFIAFMITKVQLNDMVLRASFVEIAGLAIVVAIVVGALWVNSVAEFTRKLSMAQSGKRLALFVTLAIFAIPMVLGSFSVLAAGSIDELFKEVAALRPVTYMVAQLPPFAATFILISAILSVVIASASWMYSNSVGLASLHIKVRAAFSQPILVLLIALVTFAISNLSTTTSFFVSTAISVCGVIVFAWAGIFVADVALRKIAYHEVSLTRSYGFYRSVNVANLVGFVLSIALGLGFISSDATGFGWLGYLANLTNAQQFSSANFGVLVSLGFSALFPILFTRGRIKAQEKEVLAIEARRHDLSNLDLAETF